MFGSYVCLIWSPSLIPRALPSLALFSEHDLACREIHGAPIQNIRGMDKYGWHHERLVPVKHDKLELDRPAAAALIHHDGATGKAVAKRAPLLFGEPAIPIGH